MPSHCGLPVVSRVEGAWSLISKMASNKWKDKMKLDDNVLRSFRVAKVFRENSDYVNHMSFSANGESLITSSNDDSIVIYDTVDGK